MTINSAQVDFTAISETLNSVQTADEASVRLSQHPNTAIGLWFKETKLVSYGSMTPESLLRRYGLEELKDYVEFKMQGGFE